MKITRQENITIIKRIGIESGEVEIYFDSQSDSVNIRFTAVDLDTFLH